MARRRKRFGILYHRGAAQSGVKASIRYMSVRVMVLRMTGASKERQFCARAMIPRAGAKRGGAVLWGTRAGRSRLREMQGNACAATPTIAVKRALRVFASERWY